ncbi:MAG TPA: glycosyltransferase [Acidimicrobiales bacterium]
MNLAYVSRRFGWDGYDDVGAYVSDAVRCMTDAGHRVFLLTDVAPPAGPPGLPPGVEVVAVQDADPKVRHFSELHQYADRVWATLDALCRRVRVDAAEFSQHGAEGFTAIRAKRTLGRFPDTRLVVCLHAPRDLARQVTGYGTTDFGEEIRSFAEDYCVAHADTVVAPTASLADYVEERFSRTAVRVPYPLVGTPTAESEPVVPRDRGLAELLYVGPLSPAKGADLFVEVAAHVAALEPRFRFAMVGPDTPSDPFGGSYRAHLAARTPPDVAARLDVRPLPPGGDPGRALPPFSLCLFPARRDDSPYALLDAMRRRAAVLVSGSGGMAELVEDGETGLVVDVTDPHAVARTVLGLHADAATVERLGSGARRAALRRGAPDAYRARMAAVHGARPPSRPRRPGPDRPLVSVVVPVFDQVRYVRETVTSVRDSHYDNLEVVVVDDGSTDPRARDELGALGDVVVVSHATNRGVAAARNTGVAASSGRFVMPLDGDDLIDPSYVPKALDALLRNPELAYVGCYSRNFGLLDTTYVPVGHVPNLMLFLHTDGRCTKLFARDALDRVGGYDENLPAFEDWDLYLSLAAQGDSGDVLPEQLFFYRRHRESTVFTWSNDKRIELLQFLVRKHRRLLADRYEAVVLNLLHLWKTYYEVSESVMLQRRLHDDPGAEAP